MKKLFFICLAVVMAGCEKPHEPNNGYIDTVFPIFFYDSEEQHPFYGYGKYWLSVDSFPVEKYYTPYHEEYRYDVLKYRICIDMHYEYDNKGRLLNDGIFHMDSVIYNSELYNLGLNEYTEYEHCCYAQYVIKKDSMYFFTGEYSIVCKKITFQIKNDTLMIKGLTIDDINFDNVKFVNIEN